MKLGKALVILLDLLLLAAGIATGAPIGESVRLIAVIAVGVMGGAILFVVVVYTIALFQQRQPPYDI